MRWLRLDQLHLTLEFLGNVPADSIRDLESALGPVCRSVAPFSLRAENLGCFPNFDRPRVIWVGVDGDLERLRDLESRVRPAASAFGGAAQTREFTPHLTVGRVNTSNPREARRIGQLVEVADAGCLGAWRVHELKLMRSVLSAAGAVHHCLATIPLTGGTSPAGS